MSAPHRHGTLALRPGGILALLLGVALVPVLVAPARAAGVADARISAAYVMHGRIVTAVRVRGEHRGQAVTRRWTFSALGCAGSVCPSVRLRRERSGHRFDTLTLTRVGVGSYAGSARFTSPLRCRGRRYPHGLVVPYRITVNVTQAVAIEGIAFASHLAATYTNMRRIDRTRCPIGPSHDAAQYLGAAAPLPSPPAAAFSATVHAADDSAAFTDTSSPGAGGARIVAWAWQFGDPASGTANAATTRQANHTFSAPGAYQVSLTVTDTNGLTATTAQTVIAPGPPIAAFTPARVGTSETYTFQDSSQPGFGGAPVQAWAWNFGDSSSSSNLSSAQNPQHTFSGAGTYQVCLIVTDANQRSAGHCATLVVPPSGTPGAGQAPKRTVASTAPSSPIS